MYDLDWSRRVYTRFCKDCTRTIILNEVLTESVRRTLNWEVHQKSVENLLIRAIRSKQTGDIWRLYKKIARKEMMDMDSYAILVDKVCRLAIRLREDELQLEIQY